MKEIVVKEHIDYSNGFIVVEKNTFRGFRFIGKNASLKNIRIYTFSFDGRMSAVDRIVKVFRSISNRIYKRMSNVEYIDILTVPAKDLPKDVLSEYLSQLKRLSEEWMRSWSISSID